MQTTESKKFKVAVIGMGPVGIILSVHLKEAGCEVIVCDVDKIKINLIRTQGVKLEETIVKQSFFDYVCGSVEELKEYEPDIIFVSLKTYQVQSVLPALMHLNRDGVCFISAQNGLDTEHMLSNVFGDSKTLRMVVNFAGNLNAPNVVKVTFFNPPNYIASLDDSQNDVLKFLTEKLNGVDLKTESIHSFEIIKRIWEKNILNSALSPLCGIGKLTIKEAMDMPDTVELVEVIIQEALEVAEAEKIKFEDDFVRKCLRYLKKAGNHFPSLAVDLMNNRPTEIDYMNGKIVEYGRKHYIRTSLNLALTNMVKAMTWKSVYANLPGTAKHTKAYPHQISMPRDKRTTTPNGRDNYLGIDLGSAYIKFSVIDGDNNIIYHQILRTLNKDRVAVKHVMDAVRSDFNILYSCATGYGRKQFHDADIAKTEINCATIGVSQYFPGAKNIIDIGGEDIKVIKCNGFDNVDSFYLNDKCAAGTGSFITEIAERVDIKISDMSDLASKSNYNTELNSFCTVFAKTEIMKWMFDGVSVEDIARGIYLSLAHKVARLNIDSTVPSYMIGGVIAYHHYLKNLLEEKLMQQIIVAENPQHVVSFGAALIAKQQYERINAKKEIKETITA